MPTIFRQPQPVACFFCQSDISPTPRNPRCFRCPHCLCWNRYDANGELASDEPAMHDENLNARAFAMRASPRKDRLPSVYRDAEFCHTCQTNQTLIQNLLSNYLPPPDDPAYEGRAASFADHQRSVEFRYPPVCTNCLPGVEEKIRQSDQMVRVRAFGGALKTTKGTDSRRRTSGTQREKDKLERELKAWKVRGYLWAGSFACAVVGYASIALRCQISPLPGVFPVLLSVLVVLSLLWTAWDPTYAVTRRYQFQGRVVRVHNKNQHVIMQLLIWVTRLCTASALTASQYNLSFDLLHLWEEPSSRTARIYCYTMLSLEVVACVWTTLVLRVQHPPPVRLVDSKGPVRALSASPSLQSTSSRGSTPAAGEPELFSTLSLSNNPVVAGPSHNPIFGVPSFNSNQASSSTPQSSQNMSPRSPSMDVDMDDDNWDPDAMDIDPTTPHRKRRANEDDASWLRPQRFFAPEEPTGLENLFARTIRLADSSESGVEGALGRRQCGNQQRSMMATLAQDWRIWAALCFVPLSAVVFNAWDVRRRTFTPMPLPL
ncbi:Ima1 N-terminal domain-containing protein [Epithele typhae]|uniref:Ima1 N-terminal domain-containing protein n=1 Tax=Epithele typhae TaxID=378194 RepID=UPI002008DF4A|nr:Ima1 N-terminal domain-containing protein [Epithele typhae]KAH9944286.1 Ima1 N-terminal domain-containing protein [Epithele typhae]